MAEARVSSSSTPEVLRFALAQFFLLRATKSPVDDDSRVQSVRAGQKEDARLSSEAARQLRDVVHHRDGSNE